MEQLMSLIELDETLNWASLVATNLSQGLLSGQRNFAHGLARSDTNCKSVGCVKIGCNQKFVVQNIEAHLPVFGLNVDPVLVDGDVFGLELLEVDGDSSGAGLFGDVDVRVVFNFYCLGVG